MARVRIRTLMIAAAVAAIILAGALGYPVTTTALGTALVVASPLLAFIVHQARKLGLNTLSADPDDRRLLHMFIKPPSCILAILFDAGTIDYRGE